MEEDVLDVKPILLHTDAVEFENEIVTFSIKSERLWQRFMFVTARDQDGELLSQFSVHKEVGLELQGFFTVEELRGKGLGTLLAKFFIDYCLKTFPELEIYLDTVDCRVSFYKSLGFVTKYVVRDIIRMSYAHPKQ